MKYRNLSIKTRSIFLFVLMLILSAVAIFGFVKMQLEFHSIQQTIHSEQLDNSINTYTWIFIVGFGLLMILITVAFSFLIVRMMTPIKRLISDADRIAGGNVDDSIEMVSGGYTHMDEIGMLIKAFISLADAQRMFADVMKTLSNKDLTVKFESRSDQDMLSESLSNMLATQNETLYKINVAADNVAEGSRAMLKSGTSLSKASTEQSGAIEEVTATITQIAIQSKQISENSTTAKELSDTITKFASDSNERMQEMLDSMAGIKDAADNISRIIKVIDEIAFQTNILALNASVEAARAGKEGKGFAVVANEVRSLAGRSAKAAKETEELIIGAISRVSTGVQIAEDTARALSKILESVTRNAPLIESISVATEEQYIGIEQVNQALEQVAKVIEKNSRFAEESAMASQELSMQSEMLREMVDQYKLDGKNDGETTSEAPKKTETNPENSAVIDKKKADIEIILDEGDYGKY